MQNFFIAAAGLAVLSFAAAVPRQACADAKTRISDPINHENLSVYFIHGPSEPGPVPLSLQEALDNGSVRILETGNVNELRIENTSGEDVFIQSGDIVKGGRQDRVLRMSFVLPPKSGEVALEAFCVEQGRWSARGAESASAFSSAAEAMPSREAKLAMRAPAPAPTELDYLNTGSTANHVDRPQRAYGRQQDVWEQVAKTQANLSAGLTTAVASPLSETSLQLSLENEKLQEARAAYLKALESSGAKEEDIVGYVFAVNGRISSADVYPSNAMFRKMWPKQLAAGVTEAIGAKGGEPAPAPSAKAAEQFMAAAEQGKADEQVVNELTRQEVRDADKALYVEARRSDGTWVHRNYLAK
jgi:ARG and Rhodanese-Phosphatase-superfamily-associated Protein domain